MAISTPARLPSGLVALTIATASAARAITQWPRRRAGRARCGDAVSSTLAGTAMRIAGNCGGPEALDQPWQMSQPPTAAWWASRPTTTATATATPMSRMIDHRRR